MVRAASVARLLRWAVTGLAAGAAAGFLGALLRPRRWVEYAEDPMTRGVPHRAASRS